MDDLVERLQAEQPIEASVRPEKTVAYYKEALDRGYVHVLFVRTGTELGIEMDKEACDLKGADFSKGTGRIQIVGSLVLNYDRVRFHGQLDLETLQGTGRLEYLGEFDPAEEFADDDPTA